MERNFSDWGTACPGFEMTHVYRAVWWLPHPFSLFSLFLPLFLAQPSSLFLSISPSLTHFPVRIVCLSVVRCHRTRIGSPNGISSSTVYAAVSPFAPVAILGNEVRVKRREKNETWGQAIPICEYVSIKVSGTQRQRRCPMSYQIRPNRRYFPRRGYATALCDWFISTPGLDSKPIIHDARLSHHEQVARELFGNHKSSSKWYEARIL